MAIYPTKSKKINEKSRKLKTGIVLTTVFSLLLILLSFNFIEIFTIFMLGTFGLILYPICIFFIVLGILYMCNKEIKTSKSLLLFSIFWLVTFVLILQLATSKNIDSGFGTYITTTFKSSTTAGGVIFGLLVYPLYYITYDVASYVILSIVLVILTAFIIDKIYFEIKNRNIIKTEIKSSLEATDAEDNSEEIDEEFNEEEELALESTEQVTNKNKNIDDDIFISDEEESEQKLEAKSILGLTKNTESYTEKLDKNYGQEEEQQPIKKESSKPNIYVHEDDFSSITKQNTKISEIQSESSKKDDLDEQRRKAALEYLKITNGKFETKNNKKGLDNVAPKSEVWSSQEKVVEKETPSLREQTNDNLNRLNNLNNKINILSNNQRELQTGKNPFKDREESEDINDESFTKETFKQNHEQIVKSSETFNNTISKLPKMAEQVYSGEVKENIVEPQGLRPVQVSMIEPVVRNKPTQKIYKKPPTYNKPPLDLLKRYSTSIEDDSEYIQEKGNLIVETLKAFRIETKIINAIKGPTFTRYELQMAPGISVNSVNNKINDLSMALESTCRVQVPIPGKNAFGIEVPNKKRMTVGLREMLESPNFQNSKSPLTFALGKDISADCKVASIDKLVHTLVAGSTGSGKSVCLNTMLVSLLYKASPEDLRLILVDPKTVEFSLFNNLPHLLIPNTITECDKAISALSWLVEEMDRRYKKLSALGVKKISEYNETPEVMSGSVPKMYYIVMIFDEVGDFMNRAKKEIEEKILLLAAKSRACGIHLILATQRPTVDVITGTIKANLPSRIAFAVNSYNDSKTILESSGAEYLLGMGDMLFLPQGSNDMDRIQGCFIDNNELKAVINYIKENNEADFDEEIEDQMFNKKEGFDSSNGVEDAFDPMLKDCLRYFIKAKKASASSLQGYFGIGYPKANKIVLQMEKAGFVSAGDNNGRRTLFITQQEFEERFGESLDE